MQSDHWQYPGHRTNNKKSVWMLFLARLISFITICTGNTSGLGLTKSDFPPCREERKPGLWPRSQSDFSPSREQQTRPLAKELSLTFHPAGKNATRPLTKDLSLTFHPPGNNKTRPLAKDLSLTFHPAGKMRPGLWQKMRRTSNPSPQGCTLC